MKASISVTVLGHKVQNSKFAMQAYSVHEHYTRCAVVAVGKIVKEDQKFSCVLWFQESKLVTKF